MKQFASGHISLRFEVAKDTSKDCEGSLFCFFFDCLPLLAIACHCLPNGTSQVGVLTKFDLDDAGNAISALLGDVYPLRLGYTAVVCRTGLHSVAHSHLWNIYRAFAYFLAYGIFSEHTVYEGAKVPVKQE